MSNLKQILQTTLFLVAISIGFSEKIIHMNGTYDLDGDNMLEFLALEIDPETDVFPSIVRFYSGFRWVSSINLGVLPRYH